MAHNDSYGGMSYSKGKKGSDSLDALDGASTKPGYPLESSLKGCSVEELKTGYKKGG